MRILFLGSPAFAVPPLQALVAKGYEVVGVLTQPDRPAGRHRTLIAPPVKQAAQELGLPVLQPETLRDASFIQQLKELKIEVGVVAAYGELLRKAILTLPPLGYLNIHPSLLPLQRGPAPVAGAILAGEQEVGVSIMKLDKGMDSGPILAQAKIPLESTMRTGTLTDLLFDLGSKLLLEVLPPYAAGTLPLVPQDHSRATFTKIIQKSDGQIAWNLPAEVIERRLRAYDPWPGTYTFWKQQPLKILAGKVHSFPQTAQAPGTILSLPEIANPLVRTGEGALELEQVQLAGKRQMPGQEWLRGQRAALGQQLG